MADGRWQTALCDLPSPDDYASRINPEALVTEL